MTCPAGHPSDDGASFCGTCGVKLTDPVHPAAVNRRHRRWFVVGGVVVTATAISLIVWAATTSTGADDKPEVSETSAATSSTIPEVPRLAAAFDGCDADDITDVISLADAGATVLVDTRSEYGAMSPVECLFADLGTSAAVTAQVAATSALMGAQEAVEDDLIYRWSYHPDSGLNLVITEGS